MSSSHDDSQLLYELEREISEHDADRATSESLYRSSVSDQADVDPKLGESSTPGPSARGYQVGDRGPSQNSDSPTPRSSMHHQAFTQRGRAAYSTASTGASSSFLRSDSASPPPELLASESLKSPPSTLRSPPGKIPERIHIQSPEPSSRPANQEKGKGRSSIRASTIQEEPELTSTNRPNAAAVLKQTEDEFSDPEYGGDESLARPGFAGTFRARQKDPARGLSDRERALWTWVNVVDLDSYLLEVYEYYIGKGIYCIALRRIFNLLTTGFVIVFSTFLFSCVDYSKIPEDGEGSLRDVLIDRCVSKWSVPHVLLSWCLGTFFAWQFADFAVSVPKLMEMRRFYEHLLEVPDSDISTISWSEIVRRIGSIREENPLTQLNRNEASRSWLVENGHLAKLDVHDVANRIMRQENYLVALFNKNLLDLKLRIPMPAALFARTNLIQTEDDGRSYLALGSNGLTKALEWNLRYCILGHLFDQRGRVKKDFVRGRRRRELAEQLRRRFVFMGILNAIFAPFIVIYILMYSFFRYFEEYHKNPSSIGSRQYTLFAKWKFREYNELPHLFEKRLDLSYDDAKQYVDQFPKEINGIVMRFVAFIAGAFAAVLLLLSVIDPVLLRFQITQNRSVLFYLGLFTSILAVSRGMIPESRKAFDPEQLMGEVVRHTHYMPESWKLQLHSKQVHAAFSQLFKMKIAVFFEELIAVVLTPFVLCFSLPCCAQEVVDFFREFTIHVDGIGYVCSFAVFDFKRHGSISGDQKDGPSARIIKQTLGDAEHKVERSLLHFKVSNPDWTPADPSASMFLTRMIEEGSNGGSEAVSTGNASGQRLSDERKPPFHQLCGPSSTTQKERKLREKSLLYQRALQRSVMFKSTLSNAAGNSIFGPNANAQNPNLHDIPAGFARQRRDLVRGGQAPQRLAKVTSENDQGGWETSARQTLNEPETDAEESAGLYGAGKETLGREVVNMLGQAMKH